MLPISGCFAICQISSIYNFAKLAPLFTLLQSVHVHELLSMHCIPYHFIIFTSIFQPRRRKCMQILYKSKLAHVNSVVNHVHLLVGLSALLQCKTCSKIYFQCTCTAVSHQKWLFDFWVLNCFYSIMFGTIRVYLAFLDKPKQVHLVATRWPRNPFKHLRCP